MHEFSIAEAIATQVARHSRPGASIRDVEIVVGALRGLEPEAMQMSWQAVTYETPLEGCTLTIEQRPWAITCGACGREWTSPIPFVTCECGNETPDPHGSDELDLVALTYEEEDPDDDPAGSEGDRRADAGASRLGDRSASRRAAPPAAGAPSGRPVAD